MPGVDEEEEAVPPFDAELHSMTLLLPPNSKLAAPLQSLAPYEETDLGQNHSNNTVTMKLPETITKTINLI